MMLLRGNALGHKERRRCRIRQIVLGRFLPFQRQEPARDECRSQGRCRRPRIGRRYAHRKGRRTERAANDIVSNDDNAPEDAPKKCRFIEIWP